MGSEAAVSAVSAANPAVEEKAPAAAAAAADSAAAAKARDEWTRRRGLEGFRRVSDDGDIMEIDGEAPSRDELLDGGGASDVLLPEAAVVRARRGAFGAFGQVKKPFEVPLCKKGN